MPTETIYTINFADTDLAEWLDNLTDLHANGLGGNIDLENLGDGRVQFSDRVLNWMRDYTPYDDGYIDGPGTDDDGDNYPLQMWVGGMPYEIRGKSQD
jgi:hypothetical protein